MAQLIVGKVAGPKPEILPKNNVLHIYFSRILPRFVLMPYDF